MNRRHALAAIPALGVSTISASAAASFMRIGEIPHAWIMSDGHVYTMSLPSEAEEDLVVQAALLLNDSTYLVVSSYPIYSDSEDISSRVFVLEGADEEVLEYERLRLEVEKFSSPQIAYQILV